MVRFEKDKLVIELPTSTPVEKWFNIQKGLIECIQHQPKEFDIDNFYVCDLLNEMLLGEDVICAMEKLFRNKGKEV